MTRINDLQRTIKSAEACEEWRDRLSKKWQTDITIKKVDKEILELITVKCHGNPLISLQYFVNMLHSKVIRIDCKGVVRPTNTFNTCQIINDWTTVPCPRIAVKIRLQRYSQFLYSIHSKGKNCRPGEA